MRTLRDFSLVLTTLLSIALFIAGLHDVLSGQFHWPVFWLCCLGLVVTAALLTLELHQEN